MAVYNTTPHHTTPQLLPEYRVVFMRDDAKAFGADDSTLDWMIETMRLTDADLISRLVIDEQNPDYVIATDKCWTNIQLCKQLRRYFKSREDRIFTYFSYELMEPDLNIFDYGFTWNPDLRSGDRIGRNFPYMYDFINKVPYINTFTREDAKKILAGNPKFCNFIYLVEYKHRDEFFHLLSKYKRVDSLGKHLNNTGILPTRTERNWFDLSVRLKTGYKFSIAIENAAYKGYTSEKIVSSLLAHTVPIYWGDPAITNLINPKAFINCQDYSSFEEVVERVKEIDNDDELWLDIVTQPWQTEEQRAKTIQEFEDYNKFFRNIFAQDINKAVRRPLGGWGTCCRKRFIGHLGVFLPLSLTVFRFLKGLIGKCIPQPAKKSIKKFLRMDE